MNSWMIFHLTFLQAYFFHVVQNIPCSELSNNIICTMFSAISFSHSLHWMYFYLTARFMRPDDKDRDLFLFFFYKYSTLLSNTVVSL